MLLSGSQSPAVGSAPSQLPLLSTAPQGLLWGELTPSQPDPMQRLSRAAVRPAPAAGGEAGQPLCWQLGRAVLGSPWSAGLMLTLGWVWQQPLWRALEKRALSLAASPGSAMGLNDKHSPARSPAPRRRRMEPGPVQLLANHRCCCARGWERSLSQRLGPRGHPPPPCIARRLIVVQGARGWETRDTGPWMGQRR